MLWCIAQRRKRNCAVIPIDSRILIPSQMGSVENDEMKRNETPITSIVAPKDKRQTKESQLNQGRGDRLSKASNFVKGTSSA
jgi:hypothetical protein